jgi:hypothetical protein
MGGILSQAMANLSSAEQQIQAIGGLPPDAASIQSQSVGLIREIVPEIEQLQGRVLSYVERAQSQLNQIERLLADNAPLELVLPQLKALQVDSCDVKGSVDSLALKIVGSANQVFGFANPLAAVQSQLRSQKISLQEQLSNARSEQEAIHKRYLYLLALGPFGLVGLATALGLYFKWKSDADNLEAQVNAANLQISRLDIMMCATNQLIADFRDLSSKITGVKNTIDFLAADISTIITNTEQAGGGTAIELYIKAALFQILTLKCDAS